MRSRALSRMGLAAMQGALLDIVVCCHRVQRLTAIRFLLPARSDRTAKILTGEIWQASALGKNEAAGRGRCCGGYRVVLLAGGQSGKGLFTGVRRL